MWGKQRIAKCILVAKEKQLHVLKFGNRDGAWMREMKKGPKRSKRKKGDHVCFGLGFYRSGEVEEDQCCPAQTGGVGWSPQPVLDLWPDQGASDLGNVHVYNAELPTSTPNSVPEGNISSILARKQICALSWKETISPLPRTFAS